VDIVSTTTVGIQIVYWSRSQLFDVTLNGMESLVANSGAGVLLREVTTGREDRRQQRLGANFDFALF
jgi:hypothetical protein